IGRPRARRGDVCGRRIIRDYMSPISTGQSARAGLRAALIALLAGVVLARELYGVPAGLSVAVRARAQPRASGAVDRGAGGSGAVDRTAAARRLLSGRWTGGQSAGQSRRDPRCVAEARTAASFSKPPVARIRP